MLKQFHSYSSQSWYSHSDYDHCAVLSCVLRFLLTSVATVAHNVYSTTEVAQTAVPGALLWGCLSRGRASVASVSSASVWQPLIIHCAVTPGASLDLEPLDKGSAGMWGNLACVRRPTVPVTHTLLSPGEQAAGNLFGLRDSVLVVPAFPRSCN